MIDTKKLAVEQLKVTLSFVQDMWQSARGRKDRLEMDNYGLIIDQLQNAITDLLE